MTNQKGISHLTKFDKPLYTTRQRRMTRKELEELEQTDPIAFQKEVERFAAGDYVLTKDNYENIVSAMIENAPDRFVSHGHTCGGRISPEYRSYNAAKNRCENPDNKSYRYYGGRGIEFRFDSFEAFLSELGLKPTAEHSIDRYPNKDGHYEAGNVRWATKIEQVRNQRSNRILTVGLTAKTIRDARVNVILP